MSEGMINRVASLSLDNKTRIDQQALVEVFDGSLVVAANYSGGTAPVGINVLPMNNYTYHGNKCGVDDSGGIKILVSGVYVVYLYIILNAAAATGFVRLNITKTGPPVYETLGTSYHMLGNEVLHSACGIRRFDRGDVVRMVTTFDAPTGWTWASLQVALAGALR